MTSSFIVWLGSQTARRDSTGWLARQLPHLKLHRNSSTLGVLLRDAQAHSARHRAAMKDAHAEWREHQRAQIDKASQVIFDEVGPVPDSVWDPNSEVRRILRGSPKKVTFLPRLPEGER